MRMPSAHGDVDEEESYESYLRSKSQTPIEEEEDDEDSSESPPPIPTTVGGRFDVKEMIGSGSYSEVFKGYDREAKDEVAIKLEWQRAEKGRKLLAEAKLYKSLGDCRYVPGIRWSGIEGEYNVMVMDLLGPSLEELFGSCGRRFSVQTVLSLALQMVDCIEFVHSCGIIHRDIKPHNFLVGAGSRRDRVYIMDFGLAKRYRDAMGQHIPCAKKRGVTGTVRYAGLNVHRGFEPSRRDDLEGIGNVLMHFLRGNLPWQGLKAKSKKRKHEKIGHCKATTAIEDLCAGFPEEFAKYFHHCRSLPYAERPDYAYLRGLLKGALFRECPDRDSKLDWMTDKANDGKARSRSRRRRRRHESKWEPEKAR